MIGYDLHEGQDYENLINAIKQYGSWWHCLDSTWLVETGYNAVQIRDGLRKHVKSDDRLLVVSYARPAAWYGFSVECQNWLKGHL